jgi:hypothetical protein
MWIRIEQGILSTPKDYTKFKTDYRNGMLKYDLLNGDVFLALFGDNDVYEFLNS